jgi:hypothetical protein
MIDAGEAKSSTYPIFLLQVPGQPFQIAGHSETAGGAGFGGGTFTTGATGSNLNLVNSTVSGNAADAEGGGIFSNTAMGTVAKDSRALRRQQTEGRSVIDAEAVAGARGRTDKGNSDCIGTEVLRAPQSVRMSRSAANLREVVGSALNIGRLKNAWWRICSRY